MSERDLRIDIVKILFIPTAFAIVILPTIFLLIMVKIPLSKYILRILWASCATCIYLTFLTSCIMYRRVVYLKYRDNEKALKISKLAKVGVLIFGIAIIALWIVVVI